MANKRAHTCLLTYLLTYLLACLFAFQTNECRRYTVEMCLCRKGAFGFAMILTFDFLP